MRAPAESVDTTSRAMMYSNGSRVNGLLAMAAMSSMALTLHGLPGAVHSPNGLLTPLFMWVQQSAIPAAAEQGIAGKRDPRPAMPLLEIPVMIDGARLTRTALHHRQAEREAGDMVREECAR